MQVIRKSTKFGNYLHYNHGAEARYAGKEQVQIGFAQVIVAYEQIPVGEDEDGQPVYGNGDPIYEDGDPIYEDGDDLFAADWDEAWGAPPTDEELEAWEEPAPDPPSPLTDVEIMTPVFIDYRRQATLHMDGLKAQVWSYLKNEQEMDPALATAAGVAFCKSSTGIGVQYDDYIKAGGHPDAATDLWARIQEIKAGFAWFDAGVEAIFAAALGQEV